MDANAILQALANGRQENPGEGNQALAQGQQLLHQLMAGACGIGGGGAGLLGWGGCGAPGLLNPGVTPTFPGYTPPGVVASFKTLGACGILDNDGNIYEVVGRQSVFIGAGATINIGGVAVDASALGIELTFVPVIRQISTDGTLRLLINDGYATICGWKWTETDRILIVDGKAEGDFVSKVLQTPADAFNVDGCACPIAFTCITEDSALELELGILCSGGIGAESPFFALIEGEDPTDGGNQPDSVAFGINASPFAFNLYLNVYETVGNCGTVAPLYNLAPNTVPIIGGPPAPGVACPPGMLTAGYPQMGNQQQAMAALAALMGGNNAA